MGRPERVHAGGQRNPEKSIPGRRQNLGLCGRRDVAARPADGREHFPRQPLLKRQGLGLVRTSEEKVQALFGETEHVLCPGGGLNGIDPPPFFWDVTYCRHTLPSIFQSKSNILRHKQRLSGGFAQDAQAAALKRERQKGRKLCHGNLSYFFYSAFAERKKGRELETVRERQAYSPEGYCISLLPA